MSLSKIVQEALECARYGRPKEEIILELQGLEICVFSHGCSGDIAEVWEAVKDDLGLLAYLDEIARKRIVLEEPDYESPVFFDDVYSMQERVKRMLFEERRLPQEIYYP